MGGRRTLVGSFEVDREGNAGMGGSTRAKFRFWISSLAKEDSVTWSSMYLFQTLHALEPLQQHFQSHFINILLLTDEPVTSASSALSGRIHEHWQRPALYRKAFRHIQGGQK